MGICKLNTSTIRLTYTRLFVGVESLPCLNGNREVTHKNLCEKFGGVEI